MSIFSDVLHSINKRRERSKEMEEKAGSVSMNNGNHGQIFGINKKIVVGIFILFVAVFIFAFLFASDSGNNKTKTDKNLDQQAKTEVSTKGTNNDFPNTYADLSLSDKKAAGKQTVSGGTVQAAKRTVDTATNNNSGASASAPAIRSSGYAQTYTLPYMGGYQQPQSVQVQPAAAPAASTISTPKETLKDKFSAAISFALGNSTGSDDSTASAAAPVASSSNNGAAYTAPAANSLQIGTLIPVMLMTGINTDAPGQVQVQVESDIYDSLTHSVLLIPAGSQIFGSYDDSKAPSNGRVAVTFSTLVTPDGASWNLGDSMIAVDGTGYSGIAGKVNNHTGKALSSGILASSIAALGSIASGNTKNDSDNYTAGQLAGQGAMASLVSTASELFKKGANVSATVTVDPGYEFNIYINKTINF